MSTDLITIAIPLFNETGPAEKTIAEAFDLPFNKEIIVINDGSTLPETLDILKRVKKKFPSIVFVDNPQNIGKALSIQKAIHMAKGNIFVILDADYELDPQDIIPLYRTLISSGASLVNGYRIVTDREKNIQYTSLFSKFSRMFMLFWTRVLYGTSVGDVLSGYKMFYTKIFAQHTFSSKRFGLETEFIVETINTQRKIVEIDVHYYPRSYKEGKKINPIDSIEIMLILLRKSHWYYGLRRLAIPTTLFFMSFVIFISQLRYFPTTDALPNTLVGIHVLQDQRIDLEGSYEYLAKNDLTGISVVNQEGIHYPKTSPLFGMFSAPIIWLAGVLLRIPSIPTGLHTLPIDYVYTLGKIVGAFYSAVSVAGLYMLFRKLLTPRSVSLFATVLYAFATQVFNTSAQANWQHGISLALIMLFLYGMASIHTSTRKRIATGLVGGILAVMRISNAFYCIAPIIYLWFQNEPARQRIKNITSYCLSVLVSIALFTLLLRAQGVPFGYGNELAFSLSIWTPLVFLQNLWALIASYNLGLFTGYPILLFSLVGLYYVSIRRPLYIMSLLPTCLLFFIFTASWWMWTGGYSVNARLVIEALPILILLCAYALQFVPKTTFWKIGIISTLLLSLMTNIVTIYMADSSWHDLYAKPGHRYQNELAWQAHPTYYQYHMSRMMFYITWISQSSEGIVQHNYVFRPSFVYKGIVTLFKGERLIFPIPRQT